MLELASRERHYIRHLGGKAPKTSCVIVGNELKLSNATNGLIGCLTYKGFAVVVVGDEVYTSEPCKRRSYVKYRRIKAG